MDSDLKCNRLTCRRPLTDKAVVTTCSHIFCVDCANELFNAARLCPACETNLTEPDDVVVCSLQPTNDYKTSVLSGLTPAIILEICSRAISFWQYQIHQESTFQQAVARNLNDKNAQLQKQLDNVVREANAELTLLNNKKDELERDLERERRKVRELQDGSRERDKEYAKLKLHFDKLKRKTLFGPGAGGNDGSSGASGMPQPSIPFLDEQRAKQHQHSGNQGLNANLTAVIGGMEANGIQRTPLVARANGTAYMTNPQAQNSRGIPHRQPFPAYTTGTGDTSYMSGTMSDRSNSTPNDENMQRTRQQPTRQSITTPRGWQVPNTVASSRPVPRVFAPPTYNQGTSRGFRPSIPR